MKAKSSFSRLSVLVISILLLVVNGALGTILIIQSRNDLRHQMQSRMLDILNSAAALLDGDVLERLQKEDADTPEYQYSLGILRAFQDNFNLDYIYGIRDMGNKQFTFTIDPAPDDPGEFGEPIVYTDALYSASLGVAAFDDVVYGSRNAETGHHCESDILVSGLADRRGHRRLDDDVVLRARSGVAGEVHCDGLSRH